MKDGKQLQQYERTSLTPASQRSEWPSVHETVLEMEEVPDLLAYWRVIRKRRWTILTILCVLFTLALIGTLQQTPIYRATALLEIEKENPNIPTVQELFEFEAVSDIYLETQYRILQSSSLARRVIERLGLHKLSEFTSPSFQFFPRREEEQAKPAEQTFAVAGAAEPELTPEAYQETLENFMDRLSIAPIKRSRLVEVSFESQNPERAARVVNTLASNYIEQNLEARWEATQKASEWLSQQLHGLKARLEGSEEDLHEYAQAHALLFLESEDGKSENIINERIRRFQDELTKAATTRYQKEPIYRLVEAGEYETLPGVVENKLLQDLTVVLAQLRRERAELSTMFTSDYPRVQQIQDQIDEVETVLVQERQRVAQRIVNEYHAVVAWEGLLQQAFKGLQKQANLVAKDSVQYNILKREVETNKQLYEGLLQRLKQAGVSAGLKASNIRIVDPAEPPQKPSSPNVFLNLTLAAIAGLSLGVGVALLQEHVDNTLKTPEDVERFLDLPALGLIPSMGVLNGRRSGVYGFSRPSKLRGNGRWLGKGPAPASLAPAAPWYRLDSESQQHSALAEAFRSLRTSVLLSRVDHPPQVVLISSSQPGEGKTTISTNLAISLAQLGHRVLLVDADMRRPCIHRVFDIKDSLGLVGYLTGQQEWRAARHPTTVKGLDVLVCGPTPPNPVELLSSERMRTLLREAQKEYAFAIVDSPPLLSVADSRILATLVEGVVLVVQGGVIPRELVQRAQFHVREVGGNVIGVVLNNVNVRADDYYYYRYSHYGYGSTHDSSEESA